MLGSEDEMTGRLENLTLEKLLDIIRDDEANTPIALIQCSLKEQVKILKWGLGELVTDEEVKTNG